MHDANYKVNAGRHRIEQLVSTESADGKKNLISVEWPLKAFRDNNKLRISSTEANGQRSKSIAMDAAELPTAQPVVHADY